MLHSRGKAEVLIDLLCIEVETFHNFMTPHAAYVTKLSGQCAIIHTSCKSWIRPLHVAVRMAFV